MVEQSDATLYRDRLRDLSSLEIKKSKGHTPSELIFKTPQYFSEGQNSVLST
jgi:hypothetical protein